MRMLFGIIAGIALAVGAIWWYSSKKNVDLLKAVDLKLGSADSSTSGRDNSTSGVGDEDSLLYGVRASESNWNWKERSDVETEEALRQKDSRGGGFSQGSFLSGGVGTQSGQDIPQAVFDRQREKEVRQIIANYDRILSGERQKP